MQVDDTVYVVGTDSEGYPEVQTGLLSSYLGDSLWEIQSISKYPVRVHENNICMNIEDAEWCVLKLYRSKLDNHLNEIHHYQEKLAKYRTTLKFFKVFEGVVGYFDREKWRTRAYRQVEQ